jgi:hypothetical protein
MNNPQELSVKMVLDVWNTQLNRATALVENLTEEQLQKEVAPGRNTGVYLTGHLIAVHDAMLPLLNMGDKLFPELEDTFIKHPDKSGLEKPSLKLLKQYWKELDTKLATNFGKLSAEEWFQKHNSVSAEDFVKEPHRNKLNIIITRTNHLTYHLGQLNLLK